MGQKINPNGLRLGINKTWSSRWYAKNDYAKFLHEDLKIRKYIKKTLKNASISKIIIERAAKKLRITLSELREVDFQFSEHGSEIIYCEIR